ncbi:MAG: arylsulfatase A-like enzyme [Alphaproteobacteria bacterium]
MSSKRARPNFLLFITDQHRADHLGCYGNDVVRTPAIDSIAARGTRFSQFYVATPICMPNRATLMTGRMPSLHGARHNGIPLSLSATTFVDVLASGGWKTALIGKCHLQSMSPRKPTLGMPEVDPALVLPPAELREANKNALADGNYEQELRSVWTQDPDHELKLPYYGFRHVELASGHGDKVVGHYGRWLEAQHPGSNKLRGVENQLPGNNTECPQAWRTAVPEELYPTAWVADRTCAYLEEHARNGDDEPFFIQCSFPDPHHPFTPPGKYWDMYDPADMDLPPSFNDAGPPPSHVAAIRAGRDAGTQNREGQRAIAITEREAREAKALTYGMITNVDDRVAQVLAKLDGLGLADNTVVIFTTDHGDFMGDHQLLLKGALHYQGVTRVPFIWADPAASAAGVIRDDPAGTLDIARTVLARAGLAAHNGAQGRDLIGEAPRDDPMVIEEHQRYGYMGFSHGFRARTLAGGRWRLTIYDDPNGFGELYDLDNDPDEQINLFEDPAQQNIRNQLMEVLLHQVIRLADTSPLATHHGP